MRLLAGRCLTEAEPKVVEPTVSRRLLEPHRLGRIDLSATALANWRIADK